ncbi:unnamed protein product, partial [Durusdinium trenchii]
MALVALGLGFCGSASGLYRQQATQAFAMAMPAALLVASGAMLLFCAPLSEAYLEDVAAALMPTTRPLEGEKLGGFFCECGRLLWQLGRFTYVWLETGERQRSGLPRRIERASMPVRACPRTELLTLRQEVQRMHREAEEVADLKAQVETLKANKKHREAKSNEEYIGGRFAKRLGQEQTDD